MTFRHIYICVLPNQSVPVLGSTGSLYLPSGGTWFPTSSWPSAPLSPFSTLTGFDSSEPRSCRPVFCPVRSFGTRYSRFSSGPVVCRSTPTCSSPRFTSRAGFGRTIHVRIASRPKRNADWIDSRSGQLPTSFFPTRPLASSSCSAVAPSLAFSQSVSHPSLLASCQDSSLLLSF